MMPEKVNSLSEVVRQTLAERDSVINESHVGAGSKAEMRHGYNLAMQVFAHKVGLYLDKRRDDMLKRKHDIEAAVEDKPSRCPECNSTLVIEDASLLCRRCGWTAEAN